MSSPAPYDEIADWYDQWAHTGLFHQLVVPSVLELLGDIAGQRVGDLACGQGLLARLLAERGAQVVGIDLSFRLLQIAERQERAGSLGIAYLCADAQGLAGIRDGVFDVVVCNLALMDIVDLEAACRGAGRVLRPGGAWVWSIVHPCFGEPGAEGAMQPDGGRRRLSGQYFAEGFWRSQNPNGVRGRVGSYHRTLSTYLNMTIEAGFVLERAEEPQPREGLEPWQGYRDIAVALVTRWRKPAP